MYLQSFNYDLENNAKMSYPTPTTRVAQWTQIDGKSIQNNVMAMNTLFYALNNYWNIY